MCKKLNNINHIEHKKKKCCVIVVNNAFNGIPCLIFKACFFWLKKICLLKCKF